jgi:hypothetical protein
MKFIFLRQEEEEEKEEKFFINWHSNFIFGCFEF